MKTSISVLPRLFGLLCLIPALAAAAGNTEFGGHTKLNGFVQGYPSDSVFRERFGSRVTLMPEASKIDVEYLDGPFKYLKNNWHFVPVSETECEVDFFVDFEFKSKTLQAIIGVVFNEAMRRIVRAFEQRAEALYGKRSLTS